MKLTSRGFTLVELMIVIAIIGILAAALFPSMTTYLKRSRDAARASNMKDISTSVGAYYADKETYPMPVSPSGSGTPCSASGLLNNTYMPKGVPKDPQATHDNGCTGDKGQYGYGAGVNATSNSVQFFITSNFENPAGGNYSGALTSFVGSGITVNAPVTDKGLGAQYIMSSN